MRRKLHERRGSCRRIRRRWQRLTQGRRERARGALRRRRPTYTTCERAATTKRDTTRIVTALGAVTLAAVATLAGGARRLTGPTPPPPPPVPADVARGGTLTKVLDGLDQPVALTFAPADPQRRLFIVEKKGLVRIVVDGRLQPAAAAFLDLAFHPDFAHTRRFCVNFTDTKGDTRVVEFAARADDPDHADPTSERELLFVKQPYANHNGGDVVFGPDGKLYVGLGDGGSAGDPHGNGQSDATLLGKMFRLDVDEHGERPQPIVVAKGLRNPWRYAFDPATGDLWIADVGQNRWEEIDILPTAALAAAKPVNFGWNTMEGRHCYARRNCDPTQSVVPILEYSHDEGCSITGGFVYRGHALPALTGAYFYADFCTAIIRSVRRGPDGTLRDSWEWRSALDPRSQLANISSFGEDADGELYIISLDGVVYRLDAVGGVAH